MKKFVKWFLFSVVVCGSIALAICYMVIPQETKSAADIVVEYLNTPLGIIGGTTITLGLVVGIIIKLVYDRYSNDVHSELETVKNYVQDKKNESLKYYEKALQEKEQVIEMLNGYSNRIDYLEQELANACLTSPNAKIKELGKNIQNKSKELKTDTINKLSEVNNDFVSYMEKKTNIEKLELKVDELTKIIESVVNSNGGQKSNN